MNKVPFLNNSYNKENIGNIKHFFDSEIGATRNYFLNNNPILNSLKEDISSSQDSNDIIDSIALGTNESIDKIFNDIEAA